ncbi:hypothetical protein P154DRAFT_594712 [Amniculicola lignicola CBS 123094]|uniref:Uncharacterized protein n=1 Tax=Amniculicola lignicola CBS 123094 TaxID=1392246 RepID=A0A6A5WTC6_9PLEO|nr:hypothetical protein P154DRAFT_594712 [Amniculicola lignicola CBS 123094]
MASYTGPSIAANASSASINEYYTSLSFALPASLSVAKNLTWEQTPWLLPPISTAEASLIATHISPLFAAEAVPEAFEEDLAVGLQNALPFGIAYDSSTATAEEDLDECPVLYIVFPHLIRGVASRAHFLKVWHDDIVLPVYNRAWEDSGMLSEMWGKPAAAILSRLCEGREDAMRAVWPSEDMGGDMNEVWENIRRGIAVVPAKLAADEPLGPMRELNLSTPFLLLVHRSRFDLNPALSFSGLYASVGREWDKSVDGGQIVEHSFKVVVTAVIGDRDWVGEEVDGEERELKGVRFKRMAEEGEWGDWGEEEWEQGREGKRRRVG